MTADSITIDHHRRRRRRRRPRRLPGRRRGRHGRVRRDVPCRRDLEPPQRRPPRRRQGRRRRDRRVPRRSRWSSPRAPCARCRRSSCPTVPDTSRCSPGSAAPARTGATFDDTQILLFTLEQRSRPHRRPVRRRPDRGDGLLGLTGRATVTSSPPTTNPTRRAGARLVADHEPPIERPPGPRRDRSAREASPSGGTTGRTRPGRPGLPRRRAESSAWSTPHSCAAPDWARRRSSHTGRPPRSRRPTADR